MSDLRLAVRALRRSATLSAVAIFSLALGIGANTAIFSVVNALVLRPLPVVEPRRLVTVSSGYALGYGFKAGAGMSYDMWNRMHERLDPFDGGFAWSSGRVDLSQGGETQPADALFLSGDFFTTLGVQAMIGRAFTAADDVAGGGSDGLAAVIGYRLWQRRFSGAANVIGAVLPIEGVPFTVIGVMPPEFFGIEVGQPFDVAIPLAVEPALRGKRPSLHDPRALMLTVMLRLKPEQSLEAATATLRAMQPDILGPSPQTPKFLKDPYVLVPAATGTSDRSGLRRRYARPLLTLLAVVVVVLLVACVNIANLLLARATARRYELSVRLALGASRWRLARQLLVESFVLSGVGAVAGLFFATWASRLIVTTLATADSRVLLDLSLDWRVLGLTAAASAATAILFGIGPAIRAGRAAPIEALTSYGRTVSGSPSVFSGLVVLQVSLSVILLVGAGLLLTTFTKLASAPLGFERDRVLIVEVDTERVQEHSALRADYQQQLIDAVSNVPGVGGAAASTITPFSRATRSPLFLEPGRVHEHAVTPDYFAVYGIRLRAGRVFDDRDLAGAPRVAVVSEGYVQKFFADGQPLGRSIESGSRCDVRRGGACTVVGVVADAVFGSIRAGARPTVYVPFAQSGSSGLAGQGMVTLSIRPAAGSPSQLARGVADALTAVNRNLSFSYRPLEQDVDDALTQERLVARLSTFFAALALLLSAVGLYGVTAYTVARRQVELGVRLALGSTPAGVMKIVLARTALLVFFGIVLGVGLSLWLSKFVAALLYDLGPRDPMAIAGAVITLATIAGLASAIPAFRASSIDPAEVLRQS